MKKIIICAVITFSLYLGSIFFLKIQYVKKEIICQAESSFLPSISPFKVYPGFSRGGVHIGVLDYEFAVTSGWQINDIDISNDSNPVKVTWGGEAFFLLNNGKPIPVSEFSCNPKIICPLEGTKDIMVILYWRGVQ